MVVGQQSSLLKIFGGRALSRRTLAQLEAGAMPADQKSS